MIAPIPVTKTSIVRLRLSKIKPNGISKIGLKSIHRSCEDSILELANRRQLQPKLITAAATEMKLLARRDEVVTRTIVNAASSGANKVSQGSKLSMTVG